MSNDNNIPVNTEKQNKKEQAINKKGTPDDAAQINQQVQDKKKQHQPRDNA